ncbi:MAG TPA: DUF2752 domain-containing protein [Fimbriimonadaceae bacterium]|nr:DUF2752 domain-containing protein [Fimbriimonadaceae bacterium]
MVAFRPGAERRHLRSQLAWFCFWVAVTGFGIFLHPSVHGFGTHEELGLPACPSVMLLDRPCFGCGMTTSFTATIHLDFVTAWHAHPFGPLLYLMFTASALACFWGWLKGMYFDTNTRAFNRALWVVTIAFCSFGAYRFATTRYNSAEYRAFHAAQAISSSEQGGKSAGVPEHSASLQLP